MKVEILPIEKSKFQEIAPDSPGKQFLMDGNFEIVFQSDAEGRILFSNKLFKSSFGEELILAEQVFESPAAYRQLVRNITPDQQQCGQIVGLHDRHGNVFLGKINARLDTDDSGNNIITWAILDVTEKYDYERQMVQKDEDLEKLKAQMELFLYKASHDLRSPLTTVLGLINLMRFETPNDAVLSYAGKIECSINRLDNVIKDIMRFSQNSYTRIHSEKVCLDAMVCRIIESFKNLPNFKAIHFEIEITENGTFFSDNERLEIIFTSLIRNAIMFADMNKTRPFVTVKATAAGEAVKIAVIDNGIGIGLSHLGNIFSMFYRATDRFHGAGLGLYVAKEAVTRLHGKIEVESEIGFGSVFHVCIPNDPKGVLVSRKLRLENKEHQSIV